MQPGRGERTEPPENSTILHARGGINRAASGVSLKFARNGAEDAPLLVQSLRPRRPMPYDFRKVRVLIVDDQKYGRDLLKAIMKSLGVGVVETATDGDSAFFSFRHNPADIILTDWLMEPCCGLEMTRRIRNDSKSPNPLVPIIMASGFSERWRVLQARDAGVTEYLVKPFAGKQLLDRITAVIEHPRPFIRAGSFFGPDRRRKSSFDYAGPKRRGVETTSLRAEAPGPRSYGSSASAFLTGGGL